MMKILAIAAALSGTLLVTAAGAQTDMVPGEAESVGPNPIPIVHLMTAEEVEATGIRNLAPEQRAALSQWLQRHELAVVQRVVESTEEEFAVAVGPIASRIDGGFDGWVGDTVFRLQNGQVWQQVSPSAKYYTAQAPRVTITRRPYLLHVEGVNVDIEVRRIK